MMDALSALSLDTAYVVAIGLGLLLALRLSNVAIEALPMSRARRALVARIRPVAGTILVLAYAVLVARWLLRGDAGLTPYALAAITLFVAAASWNAVRDVLEGAYLRAARTCAVGDRVQTGNIRGRIQRLGYRNVYVEGTDGELAIVPYRIFANQPVLRSAAADRTSFHIFRAPLPEDRSIPEAKRLVRETALLCHWSSIARPPQVVATANGDLEVTVFAIDPDEAPEIERAVRRALADGSASGQTLSSSTATSSPSAKQRLM
jgi:small-conductance mechanosensitive channel